MYSQQSNTRSGESLPVIANEDLTGKQSRLGVLVDDNGVLEVALPNAITDETPVLILDEGVAGAIVPVAALNSNRTRRIVLEGTCAPGDIAVMADPSTAADAGMVRELPASAATYIQVGIFLETGADGQLVEVLPINVGKAIVVAP